MPVTLSVKVTGGEILTAIASGRVTKATFAAAERARDLIEAELRSFEFEGEGEGPHFSDNVKVTLNASLTNISIEGTSNVPHAIILEEGARPHIITTDKKAMVFTVAGEKVFAKRVNHPGVANPPKPFSTVAAAVEPEIARMFDAAISSALNTPLGGSLPSSILAGIRVGRVRNARGGGSTLRLRGGGGRFLPNIS